MVEVIPYDVLVRLVFMPFMLVSLWTVLHCVLIELTNRLLT